jgi:S-adenosylmethionine hydrolase
VHVQDQVIEGIEHTFGDVLEGELVALVDSAGFVAIAVRNGNAADALKLSMGSPIELYPTSIAPDGFSER